MKMKSIFALTVLMLAAVVPQTRALADDASDDCEMPVAEERLIASLDLALRSSNFSDCRIETNENGMTIEHGDLHGWIRFHSRRTEVAPLGNKIVVAGSRYSDQADNDIQDKLTFVPTQDQKGLLEVVWVKSTVDHRNTGTIAQPSFETTYTPISTIHCKVN
jgi:hypothetical protein